MARDLLQKRAIRNIEKAGYRAHTESIFKSLNLIKVQDIYYLAILKFYSKLINNNLPYYFDDFMPHYSIGATDYNIRNPDLQLPRIRHEFPRSSLRYQLISTLLNGGSNYDSLFVRTVAFPAQVAYWTKRSWPPADTASVPCRI